MPSAGEQWAVMLNELSNKRSSIEVAAKFALTQPESAKEFFAAILGLLQVCPARAPVSPVDSPLETCALRSYSQSTELARRLAPIYLVHEICQRSATEHIDMDDDDEAPLRTTFLDAAAPFIEPMLASLFPPKPDGSIDSSLATRVRPIVTKWEQKRIFAPQSLSTAQRHLSAIEEAQQLAEEAKAAKLVTE